MKSEFFAPFEDGGTCKFCSFGLSLDDLITWTFCCQDMAEAADFEWMEMNSEVVE